MLNQVITISFRDQLPSGYKEINCTSRGNEWAELSPFITRNIKAFDGMNSKNLENLWQFSKVYKLHLTDGELNESYWKWRNAGLDSTFAYRYPMGKGAIPEFSWWGERMDYVTARKKIYFPKYKESIINTQIFDKLKTLYVNGDLLAIRDFDVYRFDLLGMSFSDVLENKKKKAGHGFVLYKMLTEL